MSSDTLFLNGVDGSTGAYLTRVSVHDIARVAQGQQLDRDLLSELDNKKVRSASGTLQVIEGVDPTRLDQAGWGVIFASGADPAIREALSELLDHRRRQATRDSELLYQEFVGPKGYRSGESKRDFLRRHGVSFGAVDPKQVPYYLLIVGDPQTIPYSFQYQLDVQYAVGRIHFDTPDEYAAYARSVVEAETSGKLALPRRAVFFGVQNPDDLATQLSTNDLVQPLAHRLTLPDAEGRALGWQIDSVLKEGATKDRLAPLLGGDQTPALLLTASHGMFFPKGDPRQLPHMGALLCRDWPGPEAWKQRIPERFYFSGDDIASEARLLGLIAFHFACYGAGVPQSDDFYHQAFKSVSDIAPHAFVSRLPQRLLGHPKGGALAVIGHVERAWSNSFFDPRIREQGQRRQLATFDSTLRALMGGKPLGLALEYFNVRYAEISTELNYVLGEIDQGQPPDDYLLADLWTNNNDARNFVIIGDPAVRLVVRDGLAQAERPAIAPVKLRPPASGILTPDSATAPEAGAPAAAAPAPGATPTAGAQPVAATPPEAAPDASPSAQSYFLGFGDKDKEKDAEPQQPGAFQQFIEKLGQKLGELVDDLSVLKVSTYEHADIDSAGADPFATARLRARTEIRIDGDTRSIVPSTNGEIDRELWAVHNEMVRQAQDGRNELLKALTGLAGSLVGGDGS